MIATTTPKTEPSVERAESPMSNPAYPEALPDTLPVAVDPRLLEILVCPLTRGPLTYDRAAGELVSRQAGLAYPVRDGIPIMLPEEARALEP
jgi:hypothetical protein